MTATLPELLKPAEVAELLRVTPATLKDWRYEGRGPVYLKQGRWVVYRADDIAKWLAKQVTR